MKVILIMHIHIFYFLFPLGFFYHLVKLFGNTSKYGIYASDSRLLLENGSINSLSELAQSSLNIEQSMAMWLELIASSLNIRELTTCLLHS